MPLTYYQRRPSCDISYRSRYVLSILRSLKKQKMELKVVCDLSPAVCVCVRVCECSCFAFLVTPWLRGTAFYCHLFAPFHGLRLLALHVLSHVLSHVVLGPLSDVTHLITPFVNHGQWRLCLSAAFGAVAPLALGGLQPMAASGPWGTLGHNKALSLGMAAWSNPS